MSNDSHVSKLWAILPKQLVGMPQPQVEDLRALHEVGVRSIISLLEDNVGLDEYESHNFDYRWFPVADHGVPTSDQVSELVQYIDAQLNQSNLVAVHCKGGKGRTGTMLAAYLIAKGASYEEAMSQIESVKPNAIRKEFQIEFLKELASTP